MKKGTISKFLEERTTEQIIKAEAADLMSKELITIEQYQDIVEKAQDEESVREHAYIAIAERLWNAAETAINEGNLAESMAIGKVYNDWLDICIKKGVL